MTADEFKRLNKQPKYRNKKVVNACGTFDSQKEYRRWGELKSLELMGAITGLRRQVPYKLIPAQYGADGKMIEKPCHYVADFEYTRDGKLIVEDCKGVRTAAYIVKRKLMLLQHGLRILET